MGTETLSTFTTTGITLTASGAYNSPFTVTSTGTINTTGNFGIYAAFNGYVSNAGTIIGHGIDGVKFTSGGTIINAGTASLIAGADDGALIQNAPATIINAGTITGTTFDGLSLFGGAVTNAGTAAVISGGQIGVWLGDSAGTVTNAGTIKGSSELGVFLEDGGTVTNAGTAAVISGFNDGVWSVSDPAIVANTGTITAVKFDGIYLQHGGAVTNYGTSAVIASSGQIGVFVKNAPGTVANTGTITAGSLFAVYLDNGGTVTNTGAAALISGADAGVKVKNAAGTVINTGTITGHSDYGVYLNDGGAVTNSGPSAVISSAGEVGVWCLNAAGTVANTGTIIGSTIFGVYLEKGGSVTNTGAAADISGGLVGVKVLSAAGYVTNDGTISGAKDHGVYLKDSGTVTNAGTIAGPVAVYIGGSGNARVVAESGAVFIGDVQALGTDNTLELAGTGTTVASIGSQFTGFSTVAFDPGSAWTISGDAAELTALSTISGFGLGDEIDLTGFAATAASYTAGIGLVLSSASASYLLALGATSPIPALATTSDGNGGTDILFGTHTLSTTDTSSITLSQNGLYLTPFTVTTAGTLHTATKYGIFSTLSSPSLLNEGTIIPGRIGVELRDGGTVDNSGAGALISGQVGVVISGAAGSVANTGTIYSTSIGVDLASGGDVTNATAAALIRGATTGVALSNAGTVTNAGTIIAANDAGVELLNGGVVNNAGNSAVIYAEADGVDVVASLGTIINAGTIIGRDGQYAVDLGGGGTVINSGTVAALVGVGAAAVHILGTGNSRVVAEGGAVFIGKVEAAGTGNTLELAGTGTTVASIGTEFTGFQTITFDPNSDWAISGTSLALADGETITGFYAGNTIDLTNILANAETYANGLLTLANGTTPLATLSLPENPGVTSANFFLQPDNSGGTYITTDALCYLRGTRILTPTGEVHIENIAIGDLLVTRFSGFRRVKWIGRQTRTPLNPEELREHAPVRIRAGALGDNTPTCDLHVSPGHSMLVSGNLLLAKLLVNGVTITQDLAPPLPIEYYQIEFEAHDCIAAHGAWSESFADAPGLRAQFDNAAGYHARYPDSRPPEALSLCAPRPEKGAKLAAALAPIAARAAAAVPPGKLRGWIDRIRAPWTIEGWAWDEANPELPVLLEVLLDGQLIGTLLACAYRKDLAKAGFGTGRCAFTWTAPLRLPADAAARLHLRRASDGAALPGSATLPADALSKPTLRLVS